MLIKQAPDIRESEVTPKELYVQRRAFLKAAGTTAVAAGAAGALGSAWLASTDVHAHSSAEAQGAKVGNPAAQKLGELKKSALSVTDEKLNSYKDATTYNNFYEFGLDKGDPARYAGSLKPRPWSIVVEGQCAKPGTYHIEDIMKWFPLEERIYRLRCVEAWSMVIPWIGFPISALLKQVEPTSKAKFIRFETLQDPKSMPGQRSGFALIDWPYVEGLRLDEAMNPLAILAVGMYGRELPNQNGAPLRLVVPWKYGFKSVKSIVRISLVDEQPKTTWQSIAANEYGFYANVNPTVDHPRWTQARERRLPSSLFSPNVRETQMFNGYSDEVASLYSGMDLRKNY